MPNDSGWPESPREEGVSGRNLGSASSQRSLLCALFQAQSQAGGESGQPLDQRSGEGGEWTEWTGGGGGSGGRAGERTGAGDEAEEGPQRAGIMAAHGGHTDPEASSLAVRP